MHETISVIIPVRSENEKIPALDCIKNTNYPKENIEIILVIGGWPSFQRNEAIKLAKGDILYFFNSDVRFESDIFNNAVCIINRDERIAGVGGPDLTPLDNNIMQRLFGYAMGSYFAHWKMRARYSQAGKERVGSEKELLLSNLAIRKDIFSKVNGFDERFYPNEENNLINRVEKMGYKFIYSPDIKVYRDRRKNIFGFIRQFYRYGQGRMRQMFVEGFLRNMVFCLPLFLLFYFCSLLFFRGIPIYFIPLLIYIIFAVIDAAYTGFKNRTTLSFILPLIYVIMHASYGIGMLSGIYASLTGQDKKICQKTSCKVILKSIDI